MKGKENNSSLHIVGGEMLLKEIPVHLWQHNKAFPNLGLCGSFSISVSIRWETVKVDLPLNTLFHSYNCYTQFNRKEETKSYHKPDCLRQELKRLLPLNQSYLQPRCMMS